MEACDWSRAWNRGFSLVESLLQKFSKGIPLRSRICANDPILGRFSPMEGVLSRWQKTTQTPMPQLDTLASLYGRRPLKCQWSVIDLNDLWTIKFLPYREARVSSCGREPLQCQCHNLIPVPPYMAEIHSNANATTWYMCLPIWQKSTPIPMPQLDTCASLYGRILIVHKSFRSIILQWHLSGSQVTEM